MTERRQALACGLQRLLQNLGHSDAVTLRMLGQDLAPRADDHAVTPGSALVFVNAALR